MNIQEKQARWALEKPLFEAEFRKTDFYKMNLVNCFCFITDRYVWDEVQAAWQVWQAAKAQTVPEQVLDAPACVGGGTFQKGVKWSTVIAAAQRHFKYTQNAKKAPSLDIDQVKKLVSGDFVLVEKQQLAQLMENMDSLGKKALGDNYVSFADIAVVLGEAQEQKG